MTISKHGLITNVEKICIQMRMIAPSGVHEISMPIMFDKTDLLHISICSRPIALLDQVNSIF